MEVPNAATEKELTEVVVDIEKEWYVYDSMGKAPLKHLLIFQIPFEEGVPDSLIFLGYSFHIPNFMSCSFIPHL